ncbi:DNA repair and recombination protein RadB [Candidatus Pacearchaeota archaeon]|nr:DNA repair and recombination protein RadB [Candidatus Pacearchaeota archaeon]
MVKISAGSYDLNKWLFGGYESDVVSVIYGGSGTGKTNFCLLVAVSLAKKDKKVIFIDSEGGFSVERVKQMVLGKTADYENVLKNIFLLKPTNFNEQKKVFDKLLSYLKDEVDLVVVDGMTALYRIDFAIAREKGNGEMQKINSELARQIKTLAETARKREIPIILTNQVYRWEDSDKMVGGDILKYWAKCWIELVNENGKRTAHLRKHRSLPEKSLNFQITNEGIRKRGWI